MKINIFELERVQSLYENRVEFNLTESGFHPFKLNELLNEAKLAELTSTTLGYGQTNGSDLLRDKVSRMYAGMKRDNVLVTNGSAEANFIAAHTLLMPGDELIMMVPNYMQIWGIAEEMGVKTKKFHLREENNWAPDLAELRDKVSSETKMIALCNPDNPTGYTLSEDEMREIVEIAASAGAWVYCDEVYRGAELDGKEIPSFIGMYDKVVVNGGLSKAYALPGLRLGWLVGPEEVIGNTWAYHDYTTITAGILSHKIGEFVLEPDIRLSILERNRSMLRDNLKMVQKWVEGFGESFLFIPPKAGGMAFMSYGMDMNSTEMMEWMRKEHGVFILAGDCYGMDGYFRLGIGAEKKYLEEGLARVKSALESVV